MLRFLQRNFSGCSDPTLFLYRKSATKFLGSEMTPPLRKFYENSSNLVQEYVPKMFSLFQNKQNSELHVLLVFPHAGCFTKLFDIAWFSFYLQQRWKPSNIRELGILLHSPSEMCPNICKTNSQGLKYSEQQKQVALLNSRRDYCH